VVVTDEFGCTGRDTIVVRMSPRPTPTITQDGNVLTASSAASYQWSVEGVPIPGATARSHTATQQGIYTVAVVNDAGCEGISPPLTVSLSSVQVVEGSTRRLKIHPQPATDHLAIELELLKAGRLQLRVTDLNGVVLMTVNEDHASGSYRRELRIDALPAGVYVIDLESGSHIWRATFVKS
jgi:hypothetical protein